MPFTRSRPRRSIADRNALVEEWAGLPLFVWKRCKQALAPVTEEDALAYGTFALIRAAELFDETRGFKFTTYAVWAIRKEMFKARKYAYTGRETIYRQATRNAASLDRLEDQRRKPLALEDQEFLDKNIALLPRRQRDLLRLHFWERMTYEAIGKRWKLTKQRVQQIARSAIAALRVAAEVERIHEEKTEVQTG